jgi:hypothetical protein
LKANREAEQAEKLAATWKADMDSMQSMINYWKIRCSDLTASVDKHKQDILDLVKALKESQLVGYKCEHIDKDQIGGDCVHCNLVVAENAVKHLQSEIAILRKPLEKIVDAKYARDEIVNGLLTQNARLQRHYDTVLGNYRKEMKENARLKETLEKVTHSLDEISTEEHENCDSGCTEKEYWDMKRQEVADAKSCLQQLSNQGDGK